LKVAVLTPAMGQAIADTIKTGILSRDEAQRGNHRVWRLDRTMKSRMKGMPEALVDEVENYNRELFERYSEAIARQLASGTRHPCQI
jgi:hypothetical protein